MVVGFCLVFLTDLWHLRYYDFYEIYILYSAVDENIIKFWLNFGCFLTNCIIFRYFIDNQIIKSYSDLKIFFICLISRLVVCSDSRGCLLLFWDIDMLLFSLLINF